MLNGAKQLNEACRKKVFLQKRRIVLRRAKNSHYPRPNRPGTKKTALINKINIVILSVQEANSETKLGPA